MNVFTQLLTHTYTRTPSVNGSEDQWGIKPSTNGTVVNAAVCFFNPSESIRINEQGGVIIRGPVLLVKSDDPLAVGDHVSIVACGGSTSETGPLTVDAIDQLTLLGGVELKRARLRRAKPVTI